MSVATDEPRKIIVQGSHPGRSVRPSTTRAMEPRRSKNSSPTSSVIRPAAVKYPASTDHSTVMGRKTAKIRRGSAADGSSTHQAANRSASRNKIAPTIRLSTPP